MLPNQVKRETVAETALLVIIVDSVPDRNEEIRERPTQVVEDKPRDARRDGSERRSAERRTEDKEGTLTSGNQS